MIATPAPLVSAQAPVATTLAMDSHGFHYTVSGNSWLTAAEVRSAIGDAALPEDAIASLKRAYAVKGYFLVAVAAAVKDRDVRVEVTQGRLANVDGPADLAAYFDGLLGRDALRTPQVMRRSLLAQAYAATEGSQPAIDFVPASEPGASALRIRTSPAEHRHAASGNVTVGNLGNRYAGHDLAQLQGQIQHAGYTLQATHSRALTGIDADSRGAYYAATTATLSRVTPAGWFQLDAGRTRYRLGVAFAPLDPGGRVASLGGSAIQLLHADDGQRWTLTEAVHRIRDRETVFNGAYALRDQRYDVLELSSQVAWQVAGLARRKASVSVAGGLKLGGLGGADGFSRGPGMPEAHFRVYTVLAGLDQPLGDGYQARFDLNAQTTPDTLPSYEQWVLGGFNALSAWLPGTLAGDRGYLGRFTVQAPAWQWGRWKLQPGLYAEHGTARYHYAVAGAPAWQRLSDAGASLTLDLPRFDTHALLAYARPTGHSNVPADVRSRQRAHAFLYLQLGF